MRRHRRAEALFKKEQQLRDGQQARARTPTRLSGYAASQSTVPMSSVLRDKPLSLSQTYTRAKIGTGRGRVRRDRSPKFNLARATKRTYIRIIVPRPQPLSLPKTLSMTRGERRI